MTEYQDRSTLDLKSIFWRGCLCLMSMMVGKSARQLWQCFQQIRFAGTLAVTLPRCPHSLAWLHTFWMAVRSRLCHQKTFGASSTSSKCHWSGVSTWFLVSLFPQPFVPILYHGPWFLASCVLPMGFLNSVAIAQHVHHHIARLCMVWSPLRRNARYDQQSWGLAQPV